MPRSSMAAEDGPTEASPLIAPEQSPEPHQESPPPPPPPDERDPGWTEDAIRTAVLATVFLTLYAFADILKYIATISLLEQGICREHYLQADPGAVDGSGRIPEHLCQSRDIQQRLAHLRGYLSAIEALVGLLLTVPYGLVVDRLGERTLAGINVVGYLLSCGWVLVVCFYWSAFPIWTAVLSPLFRAVGGGAPVLMSVIYSIAAKHVPAPKRSLCFFIFLAAQSLTNIITTLVTASMLDHGLFFTPLILNLPLGLLCIATLFLIRTDDSPKLEDSEDEQREDGSKMSSSIRHSAGILVQVLRNRNVLVLLATVPVAKAVNPVSELLWQYMPKRFDMSLADAGRAMTISTVESLVLLLVVLPIIKDHAQNRLHIMSAKVDLYIVQYGFLVQGLGCIVMAFSQSLIGFILGFLVFSLGCSTRPALQSILADMVSRDHIAVLYTVIAVGDGIGSVAGAVLLNRAFAIAIGWDDNLYLGLPFVIGAVCFIVAYGGSMSVGESALHVGEEDI